MPGCDFSPRQQQWVRRFVRNPRLFANSLGDAMPYLLLVAEQLRHHRLPGEFALLPYLESNYTPVPPSGDRAAGIWQLMPDTALDAGVRITADYDGRLDIYASTLTAIDLLRQYHDEFGDWRLADMAFNAGLYRVRGLIGKRPHDGWSAGEFGRFGVGAETHDHLAKLLALSCIISDPKRFNVHLPEPQPDDFLALVELPGPVDLQLVARLSGISFERLLHFNPGFVHGRMPAHGPYHLLVPAARRVAVETTLDRLPRRIWRHWHEVVLKQSETIDIFAMLGNIDAQALASINGHETRDALPPGTHLLLPGHSEDTDTAIAAPAPAIEGAYVPPPDSIIVHAGDSLWRIARRYDLHVDDLLHWNGLTKNAKLRPGRRLRLSEPEDIEPAAAAARAD